MRREIKGNKNKVGSDHHSYKMLFDQGNNDIED